MNISMTANVKYTAEQRSILRNWRWFTLLAV